MNDTEFLAYCDTHAQTPRCGFIPEHIARLCGLAGCVNSKEHWSKQPREVVNCDRTAMQRLVETARSKLEVMERCDAPEGAAA